MIKESEANHIEILGQLRAANTIVDSISDFSSCPHKDKIVAAKRAVLKAMLSHWDFINQYVCEDDT
jgi:hypothetical protein